MVISIIYMYKTYILNKECSRKKKDKAFNSLVYNARTEKLPTTFLCKTFHFEIFYNHLMNYFID